MSAATPLSLPSWSPLPRLHQLPHLCPLPHLVRLVLCLLLCCVDFLVTPHSPGSSLTGSPAPAASSSPSSPFASPPPSALSLLPALESAATLAYTSANNVERARNAELLAPFHTNKDCIAQCFPEYDHRILTDQGMAFLHQIEERERRGERVSYACYDIRSKSLMYRSGTLVILKSPPSQLLSFTDPEEADRWTEDREVDGEEAMTEELERTTRSRHLSLRVTGDHRMFVQLGVKEDGMVSYQKSRRSVDRRLSKETMDTPSIITARELLSLCTADCQSSARCEHRTAWLRMLACAGNGVAEEGLHTDSHRIALGLTGDQFPHFLELFGFWLGNGGLSCRTSAASDLRAVVFSSAKPEDCEWLRGTMGKVDLCEPHVQCHQYERGGERFTITEPRWLKWFDEQFGWRSAHPSEQNHGPAVAAFTQEISVPASPASVTRSVAVSTSSTAAFDEEVESPAFCEEEGGVWAAEDGLDSPHPVQSTQSFPSSLLLQLQVKELRVVIQGIWRSAGEWDRQRRVIHSSSALFCDQLVQALLHCGYSPMAVRYRKADAIHCCQWAVTWTEPSSSADEEACFPSMGRQEGIKVEPYSPERDGRIFCVTVEHNDHLIVAQRAQCNDQGVVIQQSRPIIVGQCRLILENSENSYALLLASSSLLKLLTLYHPTFTPHQTLEMKNFLLNYLANKCTVLPLFVLTPLIQSLTRLVKLGWRVDPQFADILSDVAKFLAATPRHHRVGLLMMGELIGEMNENKTGESQVEHRRTARGFRDQTLLLVWTLSMQSIRQVAQQPGIGSDGELDELMGAALSLSNSCLTFDFIGSLMDDSLDELAQMSLQIPAAWRPVMEDSATPQLFYDILSVIRPTRQAQALEVLGGLSTVRRSIFSTEDKRMAFLLVMARGVQSILASHSAILSDSAVFHQFCITLARLKTNYPLPELSKLPDYDALISLIANFTLSAFKGGSSPNSLHYLLLVWSRVVADLPYLKVEVSPFLNDFLPSISTVFIQSRLDAIVSAVREDAVEEVFEEPALSDQLRSLPALLKYNYTRSKDWLKGCIDQVMGEYAKGATAGQQGGGGGGGGGEAVRVSEAQLALLIYIWAAIIGAHTHTPQRSLLSAILPIIAGVALMSSYERLCSP